MGGAAGRGKACRLQGVYDYRKQGSRAGDAAESLPVCQSDSGRYALRSFPCSHVDMWRCGSVEEGEKLVLIMSSGKTVCTFGAGATIGSWCDGETGGKWCVCYSKKNKAGSG